MGGINRSIEVQLMKRLVSNKFLQSDQVMYMLEEYNMQEILNNHKKLNGSLAQPNEEHCYQPLGPIKLKRFDKIKL